MLTAQAIGSAIITISTFVVAMAVMYLVNAFKLLRVSAEGERYGLDLHEHGIPAYPEYLISSAGRPMGMHVGPSGQADQALTEPGGRVTLSAPHPRPS